MTLKTRLALTMKAHFANITIGRNRSNRSLEPGLTLCLTAPENI